MFLDPVFVWALLPVLDQCLKQWWLSVCIFPEDDEKKQGSLPVLGHPSPLEKLFRPPSALSPQDNPFVLGPYSQPRLTRLEAGHAGSGVDEPTGGFWLHVVKGRVGPARVPGFLVDSHEAQRAAEVPRRLARLGSEPYTKLASRKGGHRIDLISGQRLVRWSGADKPGSEERHAFPLSLQLGIIFGNCREMRVGDCRGGTASSPSQGRALMQLGKDADGALPGTLVPDTGSRGPC